jgi:hypothetical protein
MPDTEFQWGDLGEEFWRDAGKTLRASDELIKFACARHQGSTDAAAGRLAGFKGTAMAIRQAAYRAIRTTVVTRLLALASAEDGRDDGGITDTEIDATLVKMIRSPDPQTSLKAIEARGKRQEAARVRQPEPEQDDPIVTLDDIFGHCATTEAVLLLYGEMMLRGGATPGNRLGIGVGCHSPAMRLMVPKFVERFPELWPRYRAELVGVVNQMNSFVTELEKGPVLEWEEIARRVRAEAARYRRGGGVPPSDGGVPVDVPPIPEAA